MREPVHGRAGFVREPAHVASGSTSFLGVLGVAWLLGVVLGLGPGCGIGPAPDQFKPTTGDGIAPWSELGAAQVCLGEQTLGPPASAVGAFCTNADDEGARCTDDSACDSRQVCVCGRCTIAYCATASDCAAPRVCNFTEHRCDLPCGSSSECAAGEQCLSGSCRGRCITNADCQHGEVCDSMNVCIADDCTADGDCLTGERCEIQRVPRQVLEPGPIAGIGAPVVVYLDLALPASPDERAIYRAASTDGVHFRLDPETPVLTDARAPSPVADGGDVYLYYEQGDGLALRVARSADGIAFEPAITVLASTAKLHAPGVVHTGGRVVLYYQQGDGAGIGLATGDVGAALTDRGVVLAPADVEVGTIDPGTPFWVGITRVESPHAVLAGDAIRVFFSAFGQESADASKYGMPEAIPPSFSVGYAAAKKAAPDMLSVWPHGPVFDNVDAFLEHRDELGPAVIDTGADSYLMYYIDAREAQLGRLGVLGSGTRGR